MSCQAEVKYSKEATIFRVVIRAFCLEVLPDTTGVSSGTLMDGLHLSGCAIIPPSMLSRTSFHFIVRVL